MINIHLSVIITKKAPRRWFAQCVEHNIVAQGETLDDVKNLFAQTVCAEIFHDLSNNVPPLERILPATSQLERRFNDFVNMKREIQTLVISQAASIGNSVGRVTAEMALVQ